MSKDIERKLRMFYALDAKDRWEHLLIVADECDECGETELAEELRSYAEDKFFPDVKVYSNIDKVVFCNPDLNIARTTIIDFIKRQREFGISVDEIFDRVVMGKQ